MNTRRIKSFCTDHFSLYTSVIAVLLVALYVARGISEGWNAGIVIVSVMNLLYIPVIVLFKRYGFSVFYTAYAVILIFLISMENTKLFNNYSALLMICIVMMLMPKWQHVLMGIYFLAVCIAFAVNEENLIHFFIHVVRSLWFFSIVSYVLNNRFQRKQLVLFDDERKILDQLCQGKVYQKEVEGFSENTIYRKLKSARERNGISTRDQLVERYREEMTTK